MGGDHAIRSRGLAHAAPQRLGTQAIPAGPRPAHRPRDHRLAGGLPPARSACCRRPADHGDGRPSARRFCHGDAFFQGISHTGLGTYLTMQLAFVELRAGDRRALDRLSWLLGAATPTWTWPEAIHPQLGGGCMGDGHHGWAAAEFLSFVRAMLVREVDRSRW